MLNRTSSAFTHPTGPSFQSSHTQTIRYKKLNRICDIIGPAFTMKRNRIIEVVLDLTRCEGALKSRADDSGRDTVHAYVVIGQLARYGADELRNRPLHRAVGDCARTAAESSDGRNQYDGALPLLLHKMVS